MDKENKNFSDYTYVLYKWKRVLFINMLIILLTGVTYSFLIPETFKSTAIIMIAKESPLGMGGITSLSNRGGINIGAQLLGLGSGPTEDLIFGLLNSRTSLESAIYQFDLIKYYEFEDNNIDRTIKAFSSDLIFQPTESGLIEISVINKHPKLAADIANYFVRIADSLNIILNIEQAKNNRLFIESRYLSNIKDLKASEDSLKKIQEKYGVFAVPEQIEVIFQATANIEAKLAEKQIEAEIVKSQFGAESYIYSSYEEQVDLLKSKIQEMKTSSNLRQFSNILLPFDQLPEVSLAYLRNLREIEIQTKILEVILPLYEQAKVEEQKSIPTLIVIDKAVPAQLKYAPKKALVILIFLFIGFAINILFIFWGESLLIRTDTNPLQKKEINFINKIRRIYLLKES